MKEKYKNLDLPTNDLLVYRIITVFIITIVFIVLLFSMEEHGENIVFQFIFLVASAIMSYFLTYWIFLYGKDKKFLNEVLRKTLLTKELNDSGINYVFDSFKSIPPNYWKNFFQNSETVEIVVVHSKDFFEQNSAIIKEFISKSKTLTVYISDYDDIDLMRQYLKRFDYFDEKELADRIKHAEKRIMEISDKIKVVKLNFELVESYYLSDKYALMCSFNHAYKKKGKSLAISSIRDTMTYDFVKEDLKNIKERTSGEK